MKELLLTTSSFFRKGSFFYHYSRLSPSSRKDLTSFIHIQTTARNHSQYYIYRKIIIFCSDNENLIPTRAEREEIKAQLQYPTRISLTPIPIPIPTLPLHLTYIIPQHLGSFSPLLSPIFSLLNPLSL